MKRILVLLSSLIVMLSATVQLSASACDAFQQGSDKAGQRVDHYLIDSLLHRRWAVMVDCSHPERPWTLTAAPWQSPVATHVFTVNPVPTPKALLVRVGQRVHLSHIDDTSKIELAGTAMENGAEGEIVHVKVGKPAALLAGKVRRDGSVELLQSAKWKDL